MITFFRPVCVALGLALSAGAHAANVNLSGNIVFHNDIVQFDVTLLAPATNVKIWSDSWLSGVNFDPTAALWRRSGNNYSLQAQVDDDDTVAAGQGFYDTGFAFAQLTAGQYRVTLGAAVNAANGNLLSQGFAYDNQSPILLSQWNQPSYDPNANDQKGGFWRLNFTGIDAVQVVPEPASWLLVALGLSALTLRKRKHRAESAQ